MRPGTRVLVADDDPGVCRLWRDALAGAGFDAITASDGREALEALGATEVSVVVLDNVMPRLGGLDVLRALRAKADTALLPVIMVTGHDDVADRVAALEAGASDYLVKPVDVEELVARVRSQARAQAMWRSVIQRRLGERADVMAAISKLRPASRVEDTAAELCDHLATVEGVVAVAILAFVHDTAVLPLAARFSDRDQMPDPRPLLAAEAAWVQSQVAHGPLVDESGRIPWADLSLFAPIESRVTLYAPFGWIGRPLGALALTVKADGSTSAMGLSERLSAVLDFASVASTLLSPTLEERAGWDAAAERFRGVFDSRRFHPVFQPVVDLASREPVGFEALTRFDDRTPPDVELAEARRVGAHVRLEEALVERALEDASRLPREALVFVNVSPSFVVAGRFEPEVLGGLAGRVVLEVTEHERVDDYGRLRSALDRLRPAVRVCVDDAGAGYASLRHVLALRPDFVKLDAEWVRGIERDEARQALVSGLASFAEKAETRLVAEGIETEDELATLTDLGVPLGQGYLLGRPARLP